MTEEQMKIQSYFLNDLLELLQGEPFMVDYSLYV